ncbi:MAG: DUF4145 domain-containing protein [Bryobacteraceae bacterium]
MEARTFIVGCPWCKAKVAAIEKGEAEQSGYSEEAGEPFGSRLYVGLCPRCGSILAGESTLVRFKDYDAEEDEWSDVVRVYPDPPRTFTSHRIPRVVEDSLAEADRALQSNANTAACVMMGRALEAVCRHVLTPNQSGDQASAEGAPSRRPLMLGEGIKKLREKGVIDDRLYAWSQQLQAFRNLAAHPTDTSIDRQDAEDLQTFVRSIVEYIYDLADRYEEFKARIEMRKKRKRT